MAFSLAHGVDAHVMETEDWLDQFADKATSSLLREEIGGDFNETHRDEIVICRQLHENKDYRAQDAAQIMSRENYKATGAFRKEDRLLTLDFLGARTQLIFPTLGNVVLERLESFFRENFESLMEFGTNPLNLCYYPHRGTLLTENH